MAREQTGAAGRRKANGADSKPGDGVKKEELLELITYLAFYSGWPTAMSAANVAKKVLEGDQK